MNEKEVLKETHRSAKPTVSTDKPKKDTTNLKRRKLKKNTMYLLKTQRNHT